MVSFSTIWEIPSVLVYRCVCYLYHCGWDIKALDTKIFNQGCKIILSNVIDT